MKNKIKILLTVFGLFIYQSQNFGQTPNFTGTWELNFEKSNLEHRPNGLTSSYPIMKAIFGLNRNAILSKSIIVLSASFSLPIMLIFNEFKVSTNIDPK